MPAKYHIPVKTIPLRHYPVGKYTTIEFREDCAGSCRQCVKNNCIYDVFKDNYKHISTMQEPEYVYACNSCFRCIQECTKGIFSRAINPEYKNMGDQYWTPDIIQCTWYQAHTGSIPVSGAGYRGPFTGEGFDSIWTDMSEIVRPTRDGIHGREYINTCIELSRRPRQLIFDQDWQLAFEPPPIFEIPLPILFRKPEMRIKNQQILTAMAKAAQTLGTMMFVEPEDINSELEPYIKHLIPCLTKGEYLKFPHLVQKCRMLELADESGYEDDLACIRELNPDIYISMGLPLTPSGPFRAIEFIKNKVDTIHYYANAHGYEFEAIEEPRFVKDVLRDIHLQLVEKSARQQINIIVNGGIAMAEHVNKAIICGADGVVIDQSLLIAMECRACRLCNQNGCPGKLEEVTLNYGHDRIVNLMGAWRNQILEMLGAMGIREVRRLRGEVGRSMWFEDLEKECFGPIFGERKHEQ